MTHASPFGPMSGPPQEKPKAPDYGGGHLIWKKVEGGWQAWPSRRNKFREDFAFIRKCDDGTWRMYLFGGGHGNHNRLRDAKAACCDSFDRVKS